MQAIKTEIAALATEHYLDAAAFTAFLEYEDLEQEKAVEAFQDSYSGTFANLAEWAESFVEEAGLLESMPERLRSYFDFEAYGRDCELNGDIWAADLESGDIAIFWRR